MIVRSIILISCLSLCSTLRAQTVSYTSILSISSPIAKSTFQQYEGGLIVVDKLEKSIEFGASTSSVSKFDQAEVPAITAYDYLARLSNVNDPSSPANLQEKFRGSEINKLNFQNGFCHYLKVKTTTGGEITKTLSQLVDVGFSGKSVFPKGRAGFSVFAIRAKSFEMEGGLRYLNFGESTKIYTGYVGKYYGNFLFGLRTFVSPLPGSAAGSYSLITRYYMKGHGNFISLTIGSGIPQDDRSLNIAFIHPNRISCQVASAGVSHCFSKKSFLRLHAAWLNNRDEVSLITHQLDISAGIQRRL